MPVSLHNYESFVIISQYPFRLLPMSFNPQITPVRAFGPTPVPSTGGTGRAGQTQISQIFVRYLLSEF